MASCNRNESNDEKEETTDATNSDSVNICAIKKDDLKEKAKHDLIEVTVCQFNDIQEGEMKIFDMNDVGKVLLAKQNGELSAIGTKCSHYGAPLEKGALGNGRIRCPWHGACFNLATGDIEDFPGLDSLPSYKVEVDNTNVKIIAHISDLKANLRIKPMAHLKYNDDRHFIIIGGGPSGATCAETLRQEGFTGKITVVAREKYLPYDRVNIDKAMNIQMNEIQLRQEEFYSQNDITFLLGQQVVGIDVKNNVIVLDNEDSLVYDALYVATGNRAKCPDIPGSNLDNVVVIREYDHVRYINDQLSLDKHVVILGSNFIGMESAAYLVDKVAKVTIVSKETVPYENVFGTSIGAEVLKLFINKGVEFIPNSGIIRFNGVSNLLSVEILKGTIIRADLCIVAIGGVCNTEFLKNSGIIIKKPLGALEVDEYLQTKVPNIFAGGDIAYAPVYAANNVKAAIGHYALAQYHGKMAAVNMLNKRNPIKTIPFFWTRIFSNSIQYAGFGKFDDFIYYKFSDDMQFVAYLLKNDLVVSVVASKMTPIVSQYAEFVTQGNKLYRKDLRGDPSGWTKRIKSECI